VADRLTEEIPGAFQPNQYLNEENPAAHEATTGPEIWRQTDGRITAFVTGVGTGGTITGVARYLKSHNPNVLVVGADPEGSIFSGDVHTYLTEGIGEDFWPNTFDPSLVDRYVRVSDRDAFRMARRITREEGILVGGSSGTAVVAALEVARELGPDDVVVVILPDTGRNYLSKLYSDTWLLQYGLTDRPEIVRVEEVLEAKHGELPPVVTVNAHDRVRQAIDALQRYSISQAPVVREVSMDVAQFVGSIRERELLDRIFRDPDALQAGVAEVMGPPIAMVEFDEPIDLAFEALQQGTAVLVVKAGQVLGVLTRADLLEFLAHRRRA
jgi:cystathionine beta-synthase